MKISYSVENLRSLRKTPLIDLRPITILIGRNSAGKSTFLRSLVLLRQSLEAKSSAPVLWYGQYVDFGDFLSAVSLGEHDKQISFAFSVDEMSTKSRDREWRYRIDGYPIRRRTRQYPKITYKVSLGQKLNLTMRRSIELEIPDYNITVKATFSQEGRLTDTFVVNDVDLNNYIPECKVSFSNSDIFCPPTVTVPEKDESRNFRRIVNPHTYFVKKIEEIFTPLVDPRILSDNIKFEAKRILTHPVLNDNVLQILLDESEKVSFKKLYERMIFGAEENVRHSINQICAMHYSLITMEDCGDFLRGFFSSTVYIGPARARSERYYRSQELEIAEIAADGSNLPMFLASLSSSQKKMFSDWVNKLFGFGVETLRSEGHISIQIKRENMNVNVADTGYGLSQLLPVLAQVWWSSFGNRSRGFPVRLNPVPITMEQPELHLHPAHQARLADALVGAIPNETNKMSSQKPIFIVETHSESLINRLGELVEEGKLRSDDVQIVIFSSTEDQAESQVTTAYFDEAGLLTNWPYGFFAY